MFEVAYLASVGLDLAGLDLEVCNICVLEGELGLKRPYLLHLRLDKFYRLLLSSIVFITEVGVFDIVKTGLL